MRRTVLLSMILFVVVYVDAQQWLIEYPYRDGEDVVLVAGDMSGEYNYSLGYRYDKDSDIICPHVLSISQDGEYNCGDILCEGEEGAFNSAIGIGDGNIFVTAYCTDYDASDTFEKMWVAVMDPDLKILYESYVYVEEPYVSFGYTAYSVVNDNNEFVVLVKVARNVIDEIMLDCDFVFYRFDEQCNLLSSNCLENTSYSSDISDFIFISNADCYAFCGTAMSAAGVNSVSYFDKDFNLISNIPVDNPNNYPNYIRPYFISVGHCYDDNTMLMSMQTKNTSSSAEYSPLVLRVDMDMNIVDSIMLERHDVTDYVSQYNSIAYVDSNTIYVSTFEVEALYSDSPNAASVYLINDALEVLGRKEFDMGSFMNVLYIQPTKDGGCIVQAYYERNTDKSAVIYKLGVEDFCNDIVVEEYKKDDAIRSYPNPVSSILNISVGKKENHRMRMTIYDISGRRYMDEYVVSDDNIISIDLSSLGSGLYNYQITEEGKIVMEDTFIKY